MGILTLFRENGNACRELYAIIRRHRQLAWEMTKRELTEKHAGQMLGPVWALIHPALLTAVYVFVFVFVMKIGSSSTLHPGDFTTYLLAGLLPWLACMDVMSKGTAVLTANSNLVKQVVFPLEVLPVKTVISSFFTQFISMGLLLLYIIVSQRAFPITLVLLPILFLFQFVGLVGLCCMLSVVGAAFRDLRELVQILAMIGMYLMPIIFTPERLEGSTLATLLYCNPFSYMAWCFQDACCFGRLAHPIAWVMFPLLCLLSLAFGYRLFRMLRPMMGNVL